MMKNLRYISVLVFLFMVLPACEHDDYFELTNPPEFPWLNVEEFERAAVSPYRFAFGDNWGGAYYITDMVIFDCSSDILYRIPNASANYPVDVVYNRQMASYNNRANLGFNAAYDAIAIANTALDFYYENDENPYPNASLSDRENNVKRIAGELHFMRAFAYFANVRRNCPPPGTPAFDSEKILPIRKNFTDIDAALNAEFVTTKTIYEFMTEDLLKAKELLPKQYIDGVHHPSYAYGRANKYTAMAMLAKLYFMTGEYDKALTELNTIINEGPYALTEDPIQAFNRSDNTQGREVLWQAVYYDPEYSPSPRDATLFTYLDYRATNGGHGEFFRRSTWHVFCFSNLAAQQVGWMDENLDETDAARTDKRYQQLFHRLEGYRGNTNDDPDVYDQQYQTSEPRIWGDKFFRGPEGQDTNVPIIRLAELYLTRAIIYYELGDMSRAASDLNVVRKRAWDAAVAGVTYEASENFVTADNITAEMIHTERIRELAFEGDRLHYLMAMNLPIPPGEREDLNAVEYPYENLYWAIPQEELDFKIEE